jgi:uncharacterized protein with HEPN domain
MLRDRESVLDIIEAVRKILAYTADVTLTRVDPETIWDVVQNDLPGLMAFLNSLEE